MLLEHLPNKRTGGEKASRKCPNCHSEKSWKDGIRKTRNGWIQRYICRNCGYRFSESSVLSTNLNNSGKRQVCAVLTEAKNLTKAEPQKSGLAGATLDIKGDIFEFAWWMKKEGYSESTIVERTRRLKRLWKLGANLLDPESVKEVIAKQEGWLNSTKITFVDAYGTFLRCIGKTWNPPIYKEVRSLPFIPTESELDQLISSCGPKTATFLQLLKETAARAGEAFRLEWINVDIERRTITVKPEKNSNPRILKVSSKLIGMINALPRKSDRIFGDIMLSSIRVTFCNSRRRAAKKLQNPRLLKIHFHTFRHWKATMLYHQTKDILYVKEFLGHKRIEDTLLYVQIAEVIFKETNDEFTVRVATKPEEIKALLEVGFEYVCEKDALMFFRKRK